MNKKHTVETLARNINFLMGAFSISRAELAKRSGVSPRMVAYICNAEKTATIETAQNLASVFGLEGWHLIMPNLPQDMKKTKHLSALLNNYLKANSEGREMIEKVAERESKYSSK